MTGAATEIRSHGHQVIEVNVDLATRDGVNQLWTQIQSLGRPLDIACINAGVGVGNYFPSAISTPKSTWSNSTVSEPIQLAKAVVRQMTELSEAVYAASKAFVLSFAHSLRYELKETGVTVTALQPGPTDTDFFHHAGTDDTELGQRVSPKANQSKSLIKGSMR